MSADFKQLLFFFVTAVLLHVSVFLITLSPAPAPELAFKKGEIAMELLPVGGKGEGLLTHPPSKAQTPSPGISSGSDLGLTAPTYPYSSQRNGEEGEVIIHFVLNEAKELVSSEVEQSTGFEALDGAALSAIRAHYTSGKSGPADKIFRVKFKFGLKK